MRILKLTQDSKLTFKTHFHKVVSKAARSLGVARRAGKSFVCPCVLKSCFHVYVLSGLMHCASAWMSSSESHLDFLDSVVRSAKILCEGQLCCLGHRRKASALCLLYEITHRVDHPMNEYLNHFVTFRNTRASAALGVL